MTTLPTSKNFTENDFKNFKKINLESLVGKDVSVTLFMQNEPYLKKGVIYKRPNADFLKYELLSLEKDNSIASNYLSTDFLLEGQNNILYGLSHMVGTYREEGLIMSGEKYTQRKEALTKKK